MMDSSLLQAASLQALVQSALPHDERRHDHHGQQQLEQDAHIQQQYAHDAEMHHHEHHHEHYHEHHEQQQQHEFHGQHGHDLLHHSPHMQPHAFPGQHDHSFGYHAHQHHEHVQSGQQQQYYEQQHHVQQHAPPQYHEQQHHDHQQHGHHDQQQQHIHHEQQQHIHHEQQQHIQHEQQHDHHDHQQHGHLGQRQQDGHHDHQQQDNQQHETLQQHQTPPQPPQPPSQQPPPLPSLAFKVQDVVPFEGRFPSWDAFDVARRAHGEKTHTLYVCRNTVKVAIANQRRKLQVPDHWVYDRKVYVCTHGYRRISRSSGSRPRQKVRYTNCKARFTASVVCEVLNNVEVLCIKITGQHLEHDDHPVSLEQWRNYSQNRASIVEHPYLIHEAELMRRIGSNKRTAREHIETLSGKVCTMKDMHNLYARLKKREEGIKTNAALVDEDPTLRVESVLQQFVDAHVENHVSILSADDGSNEAMCLASKAMKEHFQVFPELCLLDVTINPVRSDSVGGSAPGGASGAAATGTTTTTTNRDGYEMQGFLSMDALGNAKPTFLALSSNTSTSLFRRICRDFKRTHPKWPSIKILVMDKLHPDVVDVLHHEFPDAQVLLCQFHAIKFLTSLVTQPEFLLPTVQQQETVRELMKHMVFTSAHETYNESKAALFQHLGSQKEHPLLQHINAHWEPYRNLWASYWRGIVLEFSSFFTKGMECFWNPLKNAFERTGGSSALNRSATGSGANSSAAAVATAPAVSSGVANDSGVSSNSNGPNAAAAISAMAISSSTNNSNSSTSGALTVAPVTAVAGTSSGDDSSSTSNSSGRPTADSTSNSSTTTDRRLSITKCLSEVLTMIKFIEEEWTSKMMILEMTKPLTEFSSDPLLHVMVNCLSSFAVGLVSSQLMALNSGLGASTTTTTTTATATTAAGANAGGTVGSSSTSGSGSLISVTKNRAAAAAATSAASLLVPGGGGGGCNIIDMMCSGELDAPPSGAVASSVLSATESETMVWMDRSTQKKHVMLRDCSACDCEFFALYELPCQHLIWYELAILKNKQLSVSAVGPRWFLRTFQYPKIVSQRESNEIEYHIL